MKKFVCYTCCTGGYDDILQHTVVHPDWDYIFFTDNSDLIRQKKVGHWQIRPLVFDKLTNVKNARWHKVNAHILFPEYEASLWLDANLIIKSKNVLDKIDDYLKRDTLMAVPLHPVRTCIYQEANKIIELNIDYPKTVNAEIKFLKKEKFPSNMGLHETCIMFRRHNQIKEVLDLWWKMIEKFSKRDQLSFDYAIWKHRVDVLPFYKKGTEHRTNGEFLFHYGQKHNQDKIDKKNDFYFFKKIKKTNGRRQIYLFGIKVFSYKRKRKSESKVLKNVYFFDENGEYKISSYKELPKNFSICGNLENNNIIKIHKNLKCRNIKITFFNNCSNALCILEDSRHSNGLDIDVIFQDGIGSIIKIGKETEMNGTKIWLGNGSKCLIGDNCLFSYDIIIRTTDGHTIYDNNTKEVINTQKYPCIIGNHCWIGLRTIINKNTQLSDNIIVGSGSVLTKKYPKSYCIIAGNPAKIIKENVFFDKQALYDSIRLKEYDAINNKN